MLMLDEKGRARLWQRVIDAIETFAAEVDGTRVAPEVKAETIRHLLSAFDFEDPLEPLEAVDFVVDGLWRYQTQTTHPRYFGLFNPAPATMGIAADLLVSAFDPQLAAWSVSPFAIEIERHLVKTVGEKFGYAPDGIDGTFTSGGAEANHTALLTALMQAFPDLSRGGLRALLAQPVFYISAEGHHSFLKAARMCGLGTEAAHAVAVDRHSRLDPQELASRIARDKADGLAPFMVVATAGTTSAGAIDPLARVADSAAENGLWMHVDAAWGGAAMLVPELRGLFEGLERADSITFDPHKWFSVPRGAGMYLTRHRAILDKTFRVSSAYMPHKPADDEAMDPYMHSMQWSRRFIGLKVFLSLAVAGWEGYSSAIGQMVAMGDQLRKKLMTSGWEVVNDATLPVVCFVDRENPEGRSAQYLEAIARAVLSSGQAWISTTRIRNGEPVLRACITNHRTSSEDLDALIDILDSVREH
jgi:glutamate/tyrosine decarboxylase-like PLP-dependent enzyme